MTSCCRSIIRDIEIYRIIMKINMNWTVYSLIEYPHEEIYNEKECMIKNKLYKVWDNDIKMRMWNNDKSMRYEIYYCI